MRLLARYPNIALSITNKNTAPLLGVPEHSIMLPRPRVTGLSTPAL